MTEKVVVLHQPQRLIRIAAMLELMDCSRTTLYRWVKSGFFPQPLMRGGRTLGWASNSFELWMIEQNKY